MFLVWPPIDKWRASGSGCLPRAHDNSKKYLWRATTNPPEVLGFTVLRALSDVLLATLPELDVGLSVVLLNSLWKWSQASEKEMSQPLSVLQGAGKRSHLLTLIAECRSNDINLYIMLSAPPLSSQDDLAGSEGKQMIELLYIWTPSQSSSLSFHVVISETGIWDVLTPVAESMGPVKFFLVIGMTLWLAKICPATSFVTHLIPLLCCFLCWGMNCPNNRNVYCIVVCSIKRRLLFNSLQLFSQYHVPH